MGGEWVYRDEVNKRITELLDRLQPLVADNPKNRHKTTHRQYLVLEAIEAERNKLKESKQ